MPEVVTVSKMRSGVVARRLKKVVLGEWEEYVGWLEGVEEGHAWLGGRGRIIGIK